VRWSGEGRTAALLLKVEKEGKGRRLVTERGGETTGLGGGKAGRREKA
jgi:hypothetical protein